MQESGVYTPHPLIQRLLDVPVFPGTRVMLARRLRIANSTMAAPNGLTLRIRRRLVKFIDERIEMLDVTRKTLTDLRQEIAFIGHDGAE